MDCAKRVLERRYVPDVKKYKEHADKAECQIGIRRNYMEIEHMAETETHDCAVAQNDKGNGKSTNHEREAFGVVRHGVIGGVAVGLMVASYNALFWLAHQKSSDGMSFFDHMYGGIAPGFIFSGFALASVLLIFTGAKVNKLLFDNLVKPWLSLVIHSASWMAGASVPLSLLALMESGWRFAIGIIGLGLVGGVIIALFTTCLLLAADPSLTEDEHGAPINIVGGPAGRIVMGLVLAGWTLYYVVNTFIMLQA